MSKHKPEDHKAHKSSVLKIAKLHNMLHQHHKLKEHEKNEFILKLQTILESHEEAFFEQTFADADALIAAIESHDGPKISSAANHNSDDTKEEIYPFGKTPVNSPAADVVNDAPVDEPAAEEVAAPVDAAATEISSTATNDSEDTKEEVYSLYKTPVDSPVADVVDDAPVDEPAADVVADATPVEEVAPVDAPVADVVDDAPVDEPAADVVADATPVEEVASVDAPVADVVDDAAPVEEIAPVDAPVAEVVDDAPVDEPAADVVADAASSTIDDSPVIVTSSTTDDSPVVISTDTSTVDSIELTGDVLTEA